MRLSADQRISVRFLAGALLAVVMLSACSSGPRPPAWSGRAIGHLERFQAAYLDGDARVAAREFELARTETARTGRPELVARVELNRCAARVASLDLAPCAGFEALASDASDAEHAYARYLQGRASAADAQLLPAQHRLVAAGGADTASIEDPFARLLASAVLLQQRRVTPEIVQQAVDTASHQGWRRPLLAWLGVQLKLAQEHGDVAAAERLRRRMDLVQPRTD